MGFRLQLKSTTLNDLECQFTALSSMLTLAVTKWLRLESRGFRYKVAIYYINYLTKVKGNLFKPQTK